MESSGLNGEFIKDIVGYRFYSTIMLLFQGKFIAVTKFTGQ